MNRLCPECRLGDGSCRQHPTVAIYPRYPVVDEIDDRDLLILIPAPRRSPENIGVK